jgi:O-antigen ligase
VVPQAVLAAVGLWAAWRPCETFAATPPVLAVAALALLPWAMRRSAPSTLRWGILTSTAALLFAAASALTGWDPASGFGRIALAGAIVVLIWQASRTRVEGSTLRIYALGLALLALWGGWQVLVGFDEARSAVADLPQHMQDNAIERLASGRAFASLLLPSHLAVLLATALPLLLAALRRSWKGAPWLAGCLLCVLGLIISYSPVGIALAAAASLALAARHHRWLVPVALAVTIVAMVAAFVARPDLVELEPMQLRADNWRTAAWLWSTSPVSGVGLGGYGQASQAVPFDVGNRPSHAHSLPAEWTAELGLVGVAAVAVAVIALVGLVRRLWRVQPELAVAVAVIPLHNLVDFSLYTSGVALPWAILLGWGLAATRQPDERVFEHRLRPLLITAGAVAVALAALHSTSVVVSRAAAVEETPDLRFRSLARAYRLAPWRIEALAGCGIAALESSKPELADEAGQMLARARWLRPRSGGLASLASRLDVANGRPSSAVAEAWAASRAQPRQRVHEDHLEFLIEELATVARASER